MDSLRYSTLTDDELFELDDGSALVMSECGLPMDAPVMLRNPDTTAERSSRVSNCSRTTPHTRARRKRHGRLRGRLGRAGTKRALDVIVSAFLLVVFAPLFAVVALLIKATDGGSVLFWQTRVGRRGREFWFPKFRSMVPDAERKLATLMHQNHHKQGPTFKLKRDPRVTWIGRVIRRTSIDELPQLWCVLIGRMTLVGPRPAVPREVAQYTRAERGRLAVTPGLTCIWQISGRGDLPFARQVEMDLAYIEALSLWLDLKILVLTVPAVLTGRGAY